MSPLRPLALLALTLAAFTSNVSAASILRRQDLTPDSSIYKLLASNSSLTLPDLSIPLVNTTSTDTRGSVPDLTDLSIDILAEPTTSLTASDFLSPTIDNSSSTGTKSASTFSIAAVDEVVTTSATASDISATNTFLFTVTLPVFLAAKAVGVPTSLDWTDDGCSYSPDQPAGFDFLSSCKRHDFGYRNFKAQARFTDENRLLIDDNFKKDLYKMCSTHSFLKREACEGIADVYYEAVRAFGGL